MRRSSFLIAVLTAILGISLISSANTYAADNILKKAEAEGIWQCYKGGQMKSNITASTITNITDFVTKTDDGYVKLPNGYTSVNDSDLRCNELFGGYSGGGGSFTGVAPIPSSNKGAYLEGLGYVKSESTQSGGKCFALYYTSRTSIMTGFSYTDLGSTEISTNWLCVKGVDSNGKITDATLSKDTSIGSGETIKWDIKSKSSTSSRVEVDCNTGLGGFGNGGCETTTISTTGNESGRDYSNWNDFVDAIITTVVEHASTITKTIPSSCMNGFCAGGGSTTYTFGSNQRVDKNFVAETTTDEVTAKYTIDTSTNDSRKKAINTLFGFSDYNSIALSEEERYVLYHYYLYTYYGADVICDPTGEGANLTAQTAGREQVRVYDKSSSNFNSNCYAKATKNANKKVNGYKSNNHFSAEKDFSEIAAALKGMTIDSLSDDAIAGLANATSQSTDEDDGDTSEEDPCYNGAGAMGWLLCPAIKSLDNLMSWVYDKVETQFLRIHTQDIFGAGSSGSVFDAWSKVQTLANILFIILFLVVIVSQLTGFGIDNYGIKKILPKIIITAVTINLSYIICVALIDVSNIVGVGVRSILDGSLSISGGGAASTGSQATGFVITGTVTIATIGAVIYLNNGVIATFLLLLLSVAISILFLWLILVIREVVIILGVVLAPLAFACNMLPNTEKLFKKWVDIMKAMLILYPICSLVVGAGYFAASVLSGIGDGRGDDLSTTFNLAAMIARVAPFFLIPGLLKGSIRGLGNLGAMLSQGQHALNRNTVGRIENSDRYKDFQLRQRAGMKADGSLTKRGEFMSKHGFGRRGTNRARAAYLGRLADMKRMDRFGDKDFLNARRVSEEDRNFDMETNDAMIQFDAENTDRADLVAAVSKNGGARSIAAIQTLVRRKDSTGLQQALAAMGDMSELDNRNRNKLGQALVSMKGDDLLAGLYGKQLLKMKNGETFSFVDYANGAEGNIRRDIQNVNGADIGALDDSVYDIDTSNGGTVNYSEVLRENMDEGSQWSQLVASTGNMNGKNREKVNERLIGEQARIDASVFSGTSVEQVSSIGDDTMKAIQNSGGSVQDIFASAKNDLENPQNAQYVAKMSTSKKTNLNIGQKAASISVEDPNNPGNMISVASRGHATYSVIGGTPGATEHLTEGANGKFYKDDGVTEVDIAKYRKL